MAMVVELTSRIARFGSNCLLFTSTNHKRGEIKSISEKCNAMILLLKPQLPESQDRFSSLGKGKMTLSWDI